VAAGSYVLFVMWGFNYKNYLVSGATGLALTGRYIFPVLVPLYLVATEALWGGTPRWWQRIGGGAVALFFVAAEFPWFYRAATPDWFF